MIIQNITPQIFGAKLVNKAVARKIISSRENCYCPEEISFVEIEPENEKDINALKNISQYWEHDKFAKNAYYAACAIRNDSKYYKNNKIYVLTSQNNNFDILEDEKILGVAHISPDKNNTVFLEQIQAKPEIIYSKIPEYTGIGTAMLDSLKELTTEINCYPLNESSVKNFYYKNGFAENPDNRNNFLWKKACNKDTFERF